MRRYFFLQSFRGTSLLRPLLAAAYIAFLTGAAWAGQQEADIKKCVSDCKNAGNEAEIGCFYTFVGLSDEKPNITNNLPACLAEYDKDEKDCESVCTDDSAGFAPESASGEPGE